MVVLVCLLLLVFELFVFVGFELMLCAGGQQCLQRAALRLLLLSAGLGLTVLEHIIAGRAIEAMPIPIPIHIPVPMTMTIPMPIGSSSVGRGATGSGHAVALQCRGGGIGLMQVCSCCCCCCWYDMCVLIVVRLLLLRVYCIIY